jgi:hypothetical protein
MIQGNLKWYQQQKSRQKPGGFRKKNEQADTDKRYSYGNYRIKSNEFFSIHNISR